MHRPASASPGANTDSTAALLRHFPADVARAFARLRETGGAADAALVVTAVIRDHMPDRAAAASAAITPASALGSDLGFDSMALSEMVFFFEDLFSVSITNDEIIRVRTVGELCAFVCAKQAARAAAR